MRLICILAVVCLAGLAGDARSGGQETVLPAGEQAEWNAVGRVNIAGFKRRQMCTGTLIAPDLVLTAAHCVLGPGQRPAAAEDVIFGAGWRGGVAAADAEGEALVLHDAFSGALAAGRIDVVHDLALIHLARPLEGIVPLAIAAPPEDGADKGGGLTILGYRADRPHIATRLGPCRTVRRTDAAFMTDCRVVAGTSGAPVLAETGAGWRVVGVVSAVTPDGTIAPVPSAWDVLR